MPFKAFKRIYGPAKLKKLPEKKLHIRDTRGNNLGYKAHILYPMQILCRKVMQNLVVLEHVQVNILQIDFICEQSLSYNSFTDKCFWKTKTIDSGQLRAAKRTHIDY
jgi:hypothetical protein